MKRTLGLDTAMALEEVEGETYALFFKDEDLSPCVCLSIEEVETLFVVDTGCTLTTVTPGQVEEWGLKDKIVAKESGQSVIAHFEVLGGCSGPVMVQDMPWNLLGLDVLSMCSCVIDLENLKLTFRKFQVLEHFPELITRTFNINGKDMEVALDTGQEAFLTGSQQHAEEAGLRMRDVAAPGMNFRTPHGPEPFTFLVCDVCVRGQGKEAVGDLEGTTDSEKMVLGMQFLRGFTIHINGNNNYDVSFAGENPVKTAESQPSAEAGKESSFGAAAKEEGATMPQL